MNKKLYSFNDHPEHRAQLKPWDLPAHMASKIVALNSDGCWLISPNRGNSGYLRFTYRGRTDYAHRVAYRSAKGEILIGFVIDHLCRNRACINPAHLEAVTPRENGLRGIKGVLTTHCPNGHEYSEDNTLYRSNGHRRCRACHAARERLAKRWRA